MMQVSRRNKSWIWIVVAVLLGTLAAGGNESTKAMGETDEAKTVALLKLSKVPLIDYKNASAREIIEFAEWQARNLGEHERKRLDFEIDCSDERFLRRLSLHRRNAPLLEIIEHVAASIGGNVQISGKKVTIAFTKRR